MWWDLLSFGLDPAVGAVGGCLLPECDGESSLVPRARLGQEMGSWGEQLCQQDGVSLPR